MEEQGTLQDPSAIGHWWWVVVLPSMISSQLVMRTVTTPSLCQGTSLPVQLDTGHPSGSISVRSQVVCGRTDSRPVCVVKNSVTILFTWLYLHPPSICTVNSRKCGQLCEMCGGGEKFSWLAVCSRSVEYKAHELSVEEVKVKWKWCVCVCVCSARWCVHQQILHWIYLFGRRGVLCTL